jgi:hypothetical protein
MEFLREERTAREALLKEERAVREAQNKISIEKLEALTASFDAHRLEFLTAVAAMKERSK